MKRPYSSKNQAQYFLGIDPGKSGAFGIIDSNHQFVTAELWDERILAPIANAHRNGSCFISHAVLEKVHAMPGQGVTSMFTFGTNFGEWRGMLLSNQISFDQIHPTRWMKAVLDSGKREPLHRLEYALHHWSNAPLYGPKGGKRYGIADALCMAECARQIYLGK